MCKVELMIHMQGAKSDNFAGNGGGISLLQGQTLLLQRTVTQTAKASTAAKVVTMTFRHCLFDVSNLSSACYMPHGPVKPVSVAISHCSRAYCTDMASAKHYALCKEVFQRSLHCKL